MHRSDIKFPQKHSDKQSVKQVHRSRYSWRSKFFLVHERMAEYVDATAWWPNGWPSDRTYLSLFIQTRHEVTDVVNAGATVCSKCDSQPD